MDELSCTQQAVRFEITYPIKNSAAVPLKVGREQVISSRTLYKMDVNIYPR